jgi:predicted nucleic acid-binding protein
VICLDSSLVLKILTIEEGSSEALDLLGRFIKDEEEFIAPLLLEYEVHSTLRRKVFKKELEEFRVVACLDYFYQLQIRFIHGTEVLQEATLLARQLDLQTIYDCCFLAVANQQGAILFTADERFFKVASKFYPNIKYYR